MNDAWNFSERARACVAEAVSAMPRLLVELQALLDETDDGGVRHAILELRREIESAGSELSVAGQRVSGIADRVHGLVAMVDSTEVEKEKEDVAETVD